MIEWCHQAFYSNESFQQRLLGLPQHTALHSGDSAEHRQHTLTLMELSVGGSGVLDLNPENRNTGNSRLCCVIRIRGKASEQAVMGDDSGEGGRKGL